MNASSLYVKFYERLQKLQLLMQRSKQLGLQTRVLLRKRGKLWHINVYIEQNIIHMHIITFHPFLAIFLTPQEFFLSPRNSGELLAACVAKNCMFNKEDISVLLGFCKSIVNLQQPTKSLVLICLSKKMVIIYGLLVISVCFLVYLSPLHCFKLSL